MVFGACFCFVLELPLIAKEMISSVISRVWNSRLGPSGDNYPVYPSQNVFPERQEMYRSNRLGNACTHISLFLATTVELIHGSGAVDMVSGAGDTVVIGW